MALADDIQTDVADLLDDPDYGRDIVLRRLVPGAYNEGDGSTGAATTTDFATRAIILKYNDRLVTGTLVKAGDRRCIVKVKDLTYIPALTDKMIAGGVIHSIISFTQIELGGTVMLYTLQVRR